MMKRLEGSPEEESAPQTKIEKAPRIVDFNKVYEAMRGLFPELVADEEGFFIEVEHAIQDIKHDIVPSGLLRSKAFEETQEHFSKTPEQRKKERIEAVYGDVEEEMEREGRKKQGPLPARYADDLSPEPPPSIPARLAAAILLLQDPHHRDRFEFSGKMVIDDFSNGQRYIVDEEGIWRMHDYDEPQRLLFPSARTNLQKGTVRRAKKDGLFQYFSPEEYEHHRNIDPDEERFQEAKNIEQKELPDDTL